MAGPLPLETNHPQRTRKRPTRSSTNNDDDDKQYEIRTASTRPSKRVQRDSQKTIVQRQSSTTPSLSKTAATEPSTIVTAIPLEDPSTTAAAGIVSSFCSALVARLLTPSFKAGDSVLCAQDVEGVEDEAVEGVKGDDAEVKGVDEASQAAASSLQSKQFHLRLFHAVVDSLTFNGSNSNSNSTNGNTSEADAIDWNVVGRRFNSNVATGGDLISVTTLQDAFCASRLDQVVICLPSVLPTNLQEQSADSVVLVPLAPDLLQGLAAQPAWPAAAKFAQVAKSAVLYSEPGCGSSLLQCFAPPHCGLVSYKKLAAGVQGETFRQFDVLLKETMVECLERRKGQQQQQRTRRKKRKKPAPAPAAAVEIEQINLQFSYLKGKASKSKHKNKHHNGAAAPPRPQRAHYDFPWSTIEQPDDCPYLAFFPISESGMFLQVWFEPGNGTVLFIPYGQMLILPGDTVHGGGFSTTNTAAAATAANANGCSSTNASATTAMTGNPRCHLYIFVNQKWTLQASNTYKTLQGNQDLSDVYLDSPDIGAMPIFDWA